MSQTYLAFDLGASSGRAVAGTFDGSKVDLEEIHRFTNGGVSAGAGLHWDALRLFGEMLTGLRMCVQRSGPELMGIGIDTWGVDFALLDANDELLGNPRCYRDPRVNGMMDKAFSTVSKEEIFSETGLQFMEFNTLFQLYAMTHEKSPQLEIAKTFLMMPDLFNFDRLEIPSDMLPEIAPSGTPLGSVRTDLAAEAGLKSGQVIAPACHDTGSAVAAVPMTGENSIYISSGTWALLGAELREPAISPAVLEHNFTNEGGVFDTFRFLKNISGLWMVQECRRIWENEGHSYSFAELTKLASEAPPLAAAVDPDHADFVSPGDMQSRILAYCKRTGQEEPQTHGAIVRCALEGLALKCRQVLGNLEQVLDKKIDTIHIVGGGIQNILLCQFTADATGLPVVAGPVEATAMGNILMQAYACGELGSLQEIREVVRNSTELITYEPVGTEAWDAFYEGVFVGLGH